MVVKYKGKLSPHFLLAQLGIIDLRIIDRVHECRINEQFFRQVIINDSELEIELNFYLEDVILVEQIKPLITGLIKAHIVEDEKK